MSQTPLTYETLVSEILDGIGYSAEKKAFCDKFMQMVITSLIVDKAELMTEEQATQLEQTFAQNPDPLQTSRVLRELLDEDGDFAKKFNQRFQEKLEDFVKTMIPKVSPDKIINLLEKISFMVGNSR